MVWTLPEPMLAVAVDSPVLPAAHAGEPKWDGYRALLARYADGRVVIRSRRGADMTTAFPEIAAAAMTLPEAVGLDGEVVVWADDRLAFERLQGRLNRSSAGAAKLAAQWPAHFVAFDLLRFGAEGDLTGRHYVERRDALESLFAEQGLGAPWVLCPSTTDPAVAEGWLSWSSVGMEGLVFKRLNQKYAPGRRGWRKYRARASTEAVVGAVSGSIASPATVLLGRLDASGALRYVGRTSVLSRETGRALAAQLTAPSGGHPWTGWTFSAGWGTKEVLRVELVEPVLVGEVAADVSLDTAGRWRHPVRWLRVRADAAPGDVPVFGSGNEPAAG
ncbi:ATP-dependent DNA ligase [Actinacidiphila yanglinensis]|uniref:ATP-dependent DNA ligase n=1 Tax=Actinacidiphila yanglinensis TaxID=310779 RepID=A0A1H6DMT5_9ACTN|nr:ATP-dependent DNA ligase [Actinacidiphila yanglinensis]SEG85905.1 ATP-dependent DNA ligase [Actinacidiphila yanglinensis]